MKPPNIATSLIKTLIAVAAPVAVALLASCATLESPKAVTTSPSHSTPAVADLAMVGEWGIAIEPTADVLARAQFGTKQTFTVKAGATSPVTNVETTPFDQKKYDETKKIWTEGLNQPGLQWRLILKPDHTGLQIAHDENSNQPITNAMKWDWQGPNLRLVFPEQKRFNTRICRVVSSNEWHYPMQPLGGWFVMRRK